MSYILDALKKAEAERGMGAAAGPHVAPPFANIERAPGDEQRMRWLWIVLPLLLAAALAGFAWQIWHRPHATPTPRPAMPPLAAAAPPKSMLQPLPRVEKPLRQHAAVHVVLKPKEKARRVAPSPAASKETIASLQELPPEIRQHIPPLTATGYIYSGNPADRSVLLNKRLLREGDQVAPGLTLEKLLPDSMVLNYQGHRFRVEY